MALILATHFEQTDWQHKGHFLLRQNSPNLVFTHWKQILPSLTFFLVEPSSGSASISALACTLLMWPTSSRLRLAMAREDDTWDQLLLSSSLRLECSCSLLGWYTTSLSLMSVR